MSLQSAIEAARQFLADGDPHMANYVLRDLPETKAAGLSDLVWAIHHQGDAHRNDVLAVIRDLEKWLAGGTP